MTEIYQNIRSAIFVVLGAVYTIVISILVILLVPVLGRGRLVDVLARFWARLLLFTFGIKVTVEGVHNIDPETSYVFISNHQSTMDIPVCIASIPSSIRMLAKKELFRVPFFGWAIWAGGAIRIDRQNREKAIESLDRAAQRLKKENISPLVYAEGTRSPDGKIHPFKKGGFVMAINSGRQIVPVTIKGSNKIMPKNSFTINSGHVHIYIGKPVDTSEYDFASRDALVKKIQDVIEKQFYAEEAPI